MLLISRTIIGMALITLSALDDGASPPEYNEADQFTPTLLWNLVDKFLMWVIDDLTQRLDGLTVRIQLANRRFRVRRPTSFRNGELSNSLKSRRTRSASNFSDKISRRTSHQVIRIFAYQSSSDLVGRPKIARLVRRSSSKRRVNYWYASQDDLSITPTLHDSPGVENKYEDAESYIPAKEDYVYVPPVISVPNS